MTVAERLGQDLADARRRGEPFEAAWPEAVKRATAGQRTDDRQAWASAFTATRDAWASAWERRPATRAQRAVLAVATDPDREALPERRVPAVRRRAPTATAGTVETVVQRPVPASRPPRRRPPARRLTSRRSCRRPRRRGRRPCRWDHLLGKERKTFPFLSGWVTSLGSRAVAHLLLGAPAAPARGRAPPSLTAACPAGRRSRSRMGAPEDQGGGSASKGGDLHLLRDRRFPPRSL